MSTKQFVDQQIESSKVVVFAKSDCPYSQKAKAALEGLHLKPDALNYVVIDERPDFQEIKDYLK
ncbi:hypothetical protein COOONC_06976, partial [Cooperia oncophora]